MLVSLVLSTSCVLRFACFICPTFFFPGYVMVCLFSFLFLSSQACLFVLTTLYSLCSDDVIIALFVLTTLYSHCSDDVITALFVLTTLYLLCLS